MWATEPEVRAAWEKQQQNPQVYMAAEMIRQAGFPSGPPAAYGQQPQPYAQQPQQPQQQAYPPQQQAYPPQPQAYPPQGQQPYPPQGGYPPAPQGGPQYPFPQQGQPPQPGAPAYPFQLSPAQQLPPQPVVTASTNHGGRQILVGVALLVLGIAVTAGTHSAARHAGGGSYVIAYGPIVVGVITIFKGIFNLAMGK